MPSPTTSDPLSHTRPRSATPLPFVLLPMLGATVGFAAYVASGLAIESFFMPSRSGPTLSYGQAAGLVSLPISTIIGAASGFAVAFAWTGRWLVSSALLLLVAIIGASAVLRVWNQQIAHYGRDPSEMVLFYPPLALCLIVATGTLFVTAIGVARRDSTARRR